METGTDIHKAVKKESFAGEIFFALNMQLLIY